MTVSTQGIVLREVNYKEADKILTLLTREYGKVTVNARSCRKARKTGGGVSAAAQLLVWSDVTLTEFRGKWNLTEAETKMEFRNIRRDLDKMSLASYFAEAVDSVTQDDIPADDVLALLLNSLYALDRLNKPISIVKPAFELRLMTLCGFAPSLEWCAICGGEPEQPRLHMREGVLHCKGCRVSEGISMPLDSASLAAMRHVTSCDSKKIFSFRLSEDSAKRFMDVSETFLLSQLERGFHTLDFYKQMRAMQPSS